MLTKHTSLCLLAVTVLLLGSCARPTPEPTATTTLQTATRTRTLTSTPSFTWTASSTWTPTYTPTVTLPVATPAFIGTTIPQASEPIGAGNYERLTRVAQWGRGTILAAAFSPDDSKIVVGSAFGLAIYDRYHLERTPIWMPFDEPLVYRSLSFSQDGRYLLLQDSGKLFDLNEGGFVEEPAGANWTGGPGEVPYYGGIEADSPDGRRHLSLPGQELVEYYTEIPVVTVTDTATGDALFSISDETLELEYYNFLLPEGCDLRTTEPYFVPYGPYWPYLVSFSPSGDSLTILYWTPWYRANADFSLLRIYDAETGNMIGQIGNMRKPITTFAYEPDGSHLLVGYGDGSIQLWDITHNQQTFGAWHFSDRLQYAQLTADGRYLALQSQDRLEFRSTMNGSLRSRFEALAYDLSPVDGDVAAIADSADVIRIIEIDTGKTLHTIRGHAERIYNLAFSPDGHYLASSSQDCNVKLWDTQTGQFVHYFEETSIDPYGGQIPYWMEESMVPNSRIFIYDIEFVPATDQVIGLGSWGTIVSWNLDSGATGYKIHSAPLPFYDGMRTIGPHFTDSFGVDVQNGLFYIGNMQYSLQTGEMIGEYQRPLDAPDGCASWGPTSGDGSLRFALGYDQHDGQICVLDAQSLALLYPMTVINDPNYDLNIAGLSLSPDGTQLMVATTMGAVYVYQITR